jgi:hypothetical protein
MQLLVEAIAVGIITLIALIIIAYLISLNVDQKLMLAGFLTGAAVHLVMEYTGGNDWYCKNKKIQ